MNRPVHKLCSLQVEQPSWFGSEFVLHVLYFCISSLDSYREVLRGDPKADSTEHGVNVSAVSNNTEYASLLSWFKHYLCVYPLYLPKKKARCAVFVLRGESSFPEA